MANSLFLALPPLVQEQLQQGLLERAFHVQLVEALSVEGLPYEQTPPEHEPALKAFRTNQARRLRLVRRYLAEKEQR
jgi:DNA-dependent RNA polymerase auxiliary subunit epsilon